MSESQERYAIAACVSNDGLWDWNLETNEIYFSLRWTAILGFSEGEIGNSPDDWLKRVHSKDLGRLLGSLSDHLHRGAPQFQSEHRLLHQSGSYRWVRARGIAVRNRSDHPIRLVGWLTDITDQKQQEARLKHDAWHDPLTDLPNRAYFRGQLQRVATKGFSQPSNIFALLYLDVDSFKRLNDTLGHTVGDQTLIAIANRLTHSVRPGDTISRIGGDEFAILLTRLGGEGEALQIAQRIQKSLELPVKIGEHELTVSVSIGIALSSLSHDKPADFLRDADAAMYQAKALGGGQYTVYQKSDRLSERTVGLLEDLREAVEQGRLSLRYQPIAALPTGPVLGCEAHLLWEHPERGTLSPEDFLPLAEEAGLAARIRDWMIWGACEQAKRWRDLGIEPIRVTVGIRPQLAELPGLFEAATDALAKTGLDPRLLRITLSESTLLESTSATLQGLHELTSAGVRFSVGDFGMEYSSLVCLRRLPIHCLQIDGEFVRELKADPTSGAVTGGLIELAHSFGLQVTADGVDTEDQLAFLRSKKCDEFQGQIISPPLDPEACTSYLRQRVALPVPGSASVAYRVQSA